MSEERNSKAHIVISGCDSGYSEELQNYFEEYDYKTTSIQKSEDLLTFLMQNTCDILILEARTKDFDGFELCKNIRTFSNLPLIFISRLSESADIVLGLELGGDDYMTKPLQKRELLARVNALLRRWEYAQSKEKKEPFAYAFDNFILDCKARHLLYGRDEIEKISGSAESYGQLEEGAEIIELSGAEYRLLHYFLVNAQKVITREELIEAIQGRSSTIERSPFDRSIDVQVSRLRLRVMDTHRKAKLIKTVRGDGYVFTGNVEALSEVVRT